MPSATNSNVSPIVEQRHRRLHNTYEGKDIANAGHPDWAYGCDKCRYGLIGAESADQLPGPLYLVRMYQASAGRFQFCDCQAGNMMRQFLRKTHTAVKDRTDPVPDTMRGAIMDAITTPTFNWRRLQE